MIWTTVLQLVGFVIQVIVYLAVRGERRKLERELKRYGVISE